MGNAIKLYAEHECQTQTFLFIRFQTELCHRKSISRTSITFYLSLNRFYAIYEHVQCHPESKTNKL